MIEYFTAIFATTHGGHIMESLVYKNNTTAGHRTKADRENYFTADNLIDAYLKGHRDGCKVFVDLQNIFNQLKSSSVAISDFYNNSLKDNGCYSMFMKIIMDKTYFIVAIDKDVYFNEERSNAIYSGAIDIMKKNPDVSISIMPCDSDENINRVSLRADNYIELTAN